MRRVTIHLFVMGLIFAIGLAVGCVKKDRRISAEARRVEAYTIYSMLINRSRTDDAGKLVLIASRTRSFYPIEEGIDEREFIKHNIPPGTTDETLDDYKVQDRQPQELASRFMLSNQYVLINNEQSFFESEESVSAFRATYPNSTGHITLLSNVGFNNEMNEALVYAWGYCGGDCGGGGYYLLKRENGIWKVKEEKMWIS
jgi:hypothetical protein